MIFQHTILSLLWLGFSFLHSFLASDFVKIKFERLLKSHYRFYRVTYSFLALASLTFVLWYHFSISSFLLWNVPQAEKIIALVFLIAGAAVMLFFIRRFFFDLS